MGRRRGTQQAKHPRGKIFVSDRIGSAYELTADEGPAKPATPRVAKAVKTPRSVSHSIS